MSRYVHYRISNPARYPISQGRPISHRSLAVFRIKGDEEIVIEWSLQSLQSIPCYVGIINKVPLACNRKSNKPEPIIVLFVDSMTC